MRPKDKAKELVDNYYNILPLDKYVITKDEDLSWEYNDWKEAKKCALIAVDLILSEFYADDFYLEVKQEINKL